MARTLSQLLASRDELGHVFNIYFREQWEAALHRIEHLLLQAKTLKSKLRRYQAEMRTARINMEDLHRELQLANLLNESLHARNQLLEERLLDLGDPLTVAETAETESDTEMEDQFLDEEIVLYDTE